MTDWSVAVDYEADVDHLTPDEYAAALHQAGAVTGRLDFDRSRVGFTVTVEAATLRQALAAGQRQTDQIAATLPGLGQAVRVEALTAAELAAQLRRPTLPPLVGVTEAAAILGVSPQRVDQLAREKPLFPQPVAELGCGRVWTEASITGFAQTDQRKPGRPRKPTTS